MSAAIELLKAECNRYVNGQCTTRRCVKRGMDRTGMTFPLSDYAVATCEHHEAVCEIETLRNLVECLVENDPNEAISDAGHTVLDKWRYDAKLALESKTENAPSQVHDDPPAYAGETYKDGGKRHPHQDVAHPGAHRRDLSTDATASPIRSGE